MRNKIVGMLICIQVFVKRKLGFCNTKGCWEIVDYDVEIPNIKVKRCLCKKHLAELINEINRG